MIQDKDWKELASLDCSNCTVGPTKFKSYGDWNFNISQMPKAGIPREEIVKYVISDIAIEDDQLQRKTLPNNISFVEALNLLSIQIVQNAQAFLSANNITDVLFCERLIDDGNTNVTIIEDQNYYYYIFRETS